MKESKHVRFIIATALLTAVLVISYTLLFYREEHDIEHECRFWGIVFSQNNANVGNLIRMHLDSLRSLGTQNYDGWGIAFFINADSAKKLPVIARGAPSAPTDPRYYRARDEIVQYCSSAGIAHVRRGSSGPSGGIPDPHPFRRKCVNRNFEFLLAHNGNISTIQLMNLIQTINPVYIEMNPPDYFPNYIDSDLYAIYIAEFLDTYWDSTVESCIKAAIVKLDSALNTVGGEMNFVMSDGSTLWVLNNTLSTVNKITVYYSPDTEFSDVWAAASQPLDTLSNWMQIPNKILVTLRPNERPVFTQIRGDLGGTSAPASSCRISIRSIPFSRTSLISFHIPADSRAVLAIHDATGKTVRTLLAETKKAGEYTVSWNGHDDNGQVLPNGTYFCRLKVGDQETSIKTVLAR